MKLFFTVLRRSTSKHPMLVTLCIAITLLLSSLWVIEPLYGMHAIDILLSISNGQEVNLVKIFGIWIGIYIAVSSVQGIMFYLRWKLQNHLLIDIREYYYDKMLRLDVAHHTTAKGGELMKKLDNAADSIVDLTRQILLEFSTALLTSIAFYCISFSISWKLALIATSLIPVYGILLTISVKYTRKHFYKVNSLWSTSIGRGYDALSNIFTVKSSSAEERELKTMHTLHVEGLTFLEKANVPWAILEGIGYFMLMRILLIGAGILLYTQGEISLGSVFFFQFGFFRMVIPLEMLSHSMPWWNEKIGKLQLAEDAFGKEVTIHNTEQPIILENFKGKIELKNMSFSYGNADALDSINMTIEPGQHIALVGHSGAGKSTLAMLLNRFYDATKGGIKIDGVDIKNLDMHWWRTQVGLVLQENIMFNDTVQHNIAYGRPDASDEDIATAAQRASAHEFIEKFPDKYKSEIGERGIRLSGGERQRIAIARAIMKNPKIVVLDEATSALDSMTEKKVQEGIAALVENRTAIIIAHRLSTVRSVDKIAVLDEGNLIAFDSHEELMKSCDIYKEMVELQSHGMLAE